MMIRASAIVVGFGLLAAAAHALIEATGGYGTPHAWLTIAIACGVGVGAIAIGAAWGEGRRAIALGLGLALVAGEAFALLSTAERLVAQREERQAEVRKRAQDRRTAEERLRHAEAEAVAVAAAPRLTAALAAQTALADVVAAKAAERGCAANCRALLEAQIEAARGEMEKARAERERDAGAAEARLAAARTALSTLRPAGSETPLADRLGWPAWALDVLAAALGSIAANGLAGMLLAFGAHGAGRHRVVVTLEAQQVPSAPRAAPTVRAISHEDHAARFGVEALAPVPDVVTPFDEIGAAYRAWCARQQIEPLAPGAFADQLVRLFDRADVAVDFAEGGPVALGVKVTPGSPASAT